VPAVPYRTTIRIALIAILVMGNVTCAPADERLDVYPVLSLSEYLTDNLPETLVPAPTVTPPVLFPPPPGVTPPPVNSKPFQPQSTTKGSYYDAVSMAIGGSAVDLMGPSRSLQLTYLTDGQLYAQNSRFDKAFQDHYVGFHDTENVGPNSNLWLGDTFLKGEPIFGQALIGTSATSALVGQALLQNSFTTNSFNANFTHEFSPRISLVTTADQSYFSTSGGSSASASSTTESFLQGGAAGLFYEFTPDFAAGPSYHFYDMRFSSQPRLDSQQPGVSAKWNPNARWTLSGYAGPLLLSSSQGTKYDFGYEIAALYILPRVKFSFSTARAPSLTAGLSGGGVSQYAATSASYQLARRTNVYAWLSYFQVSGSGVNQHVTSYGFGVGRQVSENVQVFAQYIGFQTNASTTSQKSLTNNLLFGVKLSASPWSWTF
jgi:hypothetical protein